jgi:hypothetical protein
MIEAIQRLESSRRSFQSIEMFELNQRLITTVEVARAALQAAKKYFLCARRRRPPQPHKQDLATNLNERL